LAIDTPIRAPAISNQMQTASLARNCQDPDYSWYEYSGWEALACLYSGQW
jgi:hypothetical protein